MNKLFNFKHIKGDLFGGITAGIVALPLALAFGVSSGLGPSAGLYGAIFVAFIGVSLLNDSALSTKNISKNEFEKILASNDVNRILVINKSIAQVFIKPELLDKERYKKALKGI